MNKALFKILSHSEKETESAGALLASLLKNGDFVALYGDLGAGKTAFVRGMAAVLAPGQTVFSPTYTIVNEYGVGAGRLCHFDMYRITGEDDLESVGFYDYRNCIIAAEWCENTPYILPQCYYAVQLEKVTDTDRLIIIEQREDVLSHADPGT